MAAKTSNSPTGSSNPFRVIDLDTHRSSGISSASWISRHDDEVVLTCKEGLKSRSSDVDDDPHLTEVRQAENGWRGCRNRL
jgi:hypothetical protein